MPARTIYLIKRLETEVTSQMVKILGTYDITPSQFIILSFVGDNKTDLSSAQLSRRFLMTPQSMNEVVTTLQRKALLEKNIDPNHKRILRISLTEKGQAMLKKCNAAMDEFEANLMEDFSPTDIDFYRHFIGRILEKTKNNDSTFKNEVIG
jgi:DNA-binding MarR family transcriptional regulator